MTSPPQSFSAHDDAALGMSKLAQSPEPGPKALAHGIIRVVVKALVLPERIGDRRHFWLLVAQTSESGDVLVSDPECGQRCREKIAVVLRIVARTRNGPNVDNEMYVRAPEQPDEDVQAAASNVRW